MKKNLCLLTSLFLMAFPMLTISCGGGSTTETAQIQESSSNDNNYSTNYSGEETRHISRNTSNSNERKTSAGNEISRICNTKWTFTDSRGNNYTLKINGIARDGESAKAELIGSGGTDYLTVSAKYTDFRHENFECYSFDESAHTDIFFPSCQNQFDYGFFSIMRWDYDAGFLYKDRTSFDTESPVDRLVITKKK